MIRRRIAKGGSLGPARAFSEIPLIEQPFRPIRSFVLPLAPLGAFPLCRHPGPMLGCTIVSHEPIPNGLSGVPNGELTLPTVEPLFRQRRLRGTPAAIWTRFKTGVFSSPHQTSQSVLLTMVTTHDEFEFVEGGDRVGR